MVISRREQEAAKQALLKGFLNPYRLIITESLLKSFTVGFRKFSREYKIKMDENKVSAELAVEHITDQQMGQLDMIHQGAASEAASELQEALMQGMPLDEFSRQLSERIQEKIKGEVITLPNGYRTTVDNYVDTIVRTSTRQARDAGNKEAALSSGIIDEEYCIAISTRLPNTCKYCRARHGHKIKMSDPILLHPRCVVGGRTPVLTEKGWVRIMNVKVGDKVLTHRGRFKKVLQTHCHRRNPRDFISIKYKVTKGQTAVLRLTPEHPLLVEGKWKKVSDISVGDKLTMLSKKCANPKCKNPVRITSGSFTKIKFCSGHCSSQVVLTNLWKTKKWREDVIPKFTKSIKKRYKEGKIDTKKITEKAHMKTREMVRNGTHNFFDPEVRVKMAKKLGSLNNGGTYIEKKIRWLLKQKNIDFEAQHPIPRGVDSLNRQRYYFVDFAIPNKKIVIECDGVYWHNPSKDLERQKLIESQGWHVVRFPEEDIRNNLKKCSETIDRVLMNHEGKYMFKEVEVVELNFGKRAYHTPVYNLTVEDDESFILSSIVSHNCNCSRGMLYKKDLGIPQTYTKRELDAQRKRIKKQPADWKALEEKARRTLV